LKQFNNKHVYSSQRPNESGRKYVEKKKINIKITKSHSILRIYTRCKLIFDSLIAYDMSENIELCHEFHSYAKVRNK